MERVKAAGASTVTNRPSAQTGNWQNRMQSQSVPQVDAWGTAACQGHWPNIGGTVEQGDSAWLVSLLVAYQTRTYQACCPGLRPQSSHVDSRSLGEGSKIA